MYFLPSLVFVLYLGAMCIVRGYETGETSIYLVQWLALFVGPYVYVVWKFSRRKAAIENG